jgi:pyrroloquinoline-quinone synthase
MITAQLKEAFDDAIATRRLLEHPYYRRWQEGLLSLEDLAAYAEQYRHFEQSLPGVLETVADRLDGTARCLVENNLRDETSVPRAHVELFEGFASAVNARSNAEPSVATDGLVELYERAAATSAAAALAVIGAYEMQASEVALTKAHALRAHYGMGGSGTEFWDLHGEIEKDHASWTVEALAQSDGDLSTVAEFATASAEAWWSFLDEREAAVDH